MEDIDVEPSWCGSFEGQAEGGDLQNSRRSRLGHSMSIQPMILGHVLKFTYNLPYLFAIKDYRLSQFFVYSMLFVFKIQGSEYLIFW